jgi:hypothetical protein
MSQAEVDQLSQGIEIDALKAYDRAVAVNTRDFIATFDFERLDAPFDAQARLALSSWARDPRSTAPTDRDPAAVLAGQEAKDALGKPIRVDQVQPVSEAIPSLDGGGGSEPAQPIGIARTWVGAVEGEVRDLDPT